MNPADSSIVGYNGITYRVLRPATEMQIDLQVPLEVDSMIPGGKQLGFRRDGNAYFVKLEAPQPVGSRQTVTAYYHGSFAVRGSETPRRRRGGRGPFHWATDSTAAPWIATSNEGPGASTWWPLKDLPADEPDSQRIAITLPDPLKDISNGRLRSTTHDADGTTTYEWFVSNPINGTYGVNNMPSSEDRYPKGANMLMTMRAVVNDDAKWLATLRGLNQTFRHQTVTAQQIRDYMSATTGVDLTKIFVQHQETIMIPVRQYRLEKGSLSYRWSNVISGFDMPVDVVLAGQRYTRLRPTEHWQSTSAGLGVGAVLKVAPAFYVNVESVSTLRRARVQVLERPDDRRVAARFDRVAEP